MTKQELIQDIQASPKVLALMGDPILEGQTGAVSRYQQKVLFQVGEEAELRGLLFYVLNDGTLEESAYYTTSNRGQVHNQSLKDKAKVVFAQMKAAGEVSAARVIEEDADGEYLVARVLLNDPRNAGNGPNDVDRPDFIVDYRITFDANHPAGCSWRALTDADRDKIIQYETLKAGGTI